MFVGLHVMLSEMTGEEAWAIEDKDGEAFMSKAQNVMRHYGIKSQQKTIDWIAFGGCCVQIYAPRFGYMMRKRQDQRRGQRGPLGLRGQVIRPAAFAASPESEDQAIVIEPMPEDLN